MKMIKKLALLLCVVMVLCSFTIASFAETEGEATIVIEADKTNPMPGDTIEFTVSLVNADKMDGGVWNVEFKLAMPEGLTFVEGSAVVDTTTFTGAFFNKNLKWGSFGRVGTGYTGEKLALVKFQCTLAEDFAGDLVLTTVADSLKLTNKDGNPVKPTAPEYKLHVCDPVDVAEVPATCEENGVKAHQKCSCGLIYLDSMLATEEDLVIEALNHPNAADAEYEQWYVYEDESLYDLVKLCPDCNEVLECYVPGTQMNPLFIFDQNFDTLDVEYAFTTLAGEDTYLLGYGLGGMILTLKAEGVTVTVDGVALEAVDGVYTCTMTDYGMRGANSIVIKSETAQELELVLTYAEGSFMNPDELELGWITNEIPADSRGYIYNWTAEADGLLVVIMHSDNWTCVINNAGAGNYGDTYNSDDEVVVRAQVVAVSAGDVIELVIGTADYAAAAVDFTAYFYAGTAEDPALLDFFWNEEQTEATLNAALPAGEYVYGQYRIGGMNLTVNEVETAITNNGFMFPSTFAVAAEEAGVYNLVLTYPVGDRMNPDELVEGDNVAEIEANTQGYFYEWTATEDGTVTITVSADGGYSFSVNNLTTEIYGDIMNSDSEELVNPVVLEVKAGETIQVIVNTYDPENIYETPAGTVTVNFDFVSAPAQTGDPITLVLAAALVSGMSVVALTKKKEN